MWRKIHHHQIELRGLALPLHDDNVLLGAIVRLNPDGTLDVTFNPGVSGRAGLSAGNAVYCVAVQTNGQILVGGNLTTLAGAAHTCIGRLNADGSADATFNTCTGGNYPDVRCLLIQPNGQILVGGSFASLNGQSHQGIGRLTADGTVDTNFTADVSAMYPSVSGLALNGDGSLLVPALVPHGD